VPEPAKDKEEKMKDIALKTAGVIFLLVSILHLLRIILKVEVIVGGLTLPLWTSIAGFLLGILLALWFFSALK
jgi:hypothetical protein